MIRREVRPDVEDWRSGDPVGLLVTSGAAQSAPFTPRQLSAPARSLVAIPDDQTFERLRQPGLHLAQHGQV